MWKNAYTRMENDTKGCFSLYRDHYKYYSKARQIITGLQVYPEFTINNKSVSIVQIMTVPIM